MTPILPKVLVVLATCLTLVSPALADDSEGLVASGNGGSVVEFAQRASLARLQNTPVQFRGQCASACTLFLSVPTSQTCIWPGTSFIFHQAHGATAAMNQWGTNYLMGQYPAWVRQWIQAHGGLSDQWLTMDYTYASRFIEICD